MFKFSSALEWKLSCCSISESITETPVSALTLIWLHIKKKKETGNWESFLVSHPAEAHALDWCRPPYTPGQHANRKIGRSLVSGLWTNDILMLLQGARSSSSFSSLAELTGHWSRDSEQLYSSISVCFGVFNFIFFNLIFLLSTSSQTGQMLSSGGLFRSV